jgi:hypothetical protein
MPTNRRFPPPGSVEEQPACFVVRDHSGHGYFYFEEEPGVMAFIIGPAMAICVWLWICVSRFCTKQKISGAIVGCYRRWLPPSTTLDREGNQWVGILPY